MLVEVPDRLEKTSKSLSARRKRSCVHRQVSEPSHRVVDREVSESVLVVNLVMAMTVVVMSMAMVVSAAAIIMGVGVREGGKHEAWDDGGQGSNGKVG